MKTSIRTSLFAFATAAVSFTAACATEADVDSYDDVDSRGGKEDAFNSTAVDRLADIPFYFSVPKSAVTIPLNRAAYPYPTLWNKSMQGDEAGLRIIAIRQTAGVAAHKTARREMATKLAAAGVLQDGDLVLTFRPELAGTMAYPHIQMGATHAGLVYTENGAAYNIDSPLDSMYVGQFDSAHYAGNGTDDAGTDALQIVRPRVMEQAGRRDKLKTWIKSLKSALPRINGARQQVKFQSDYMTPAFVSSGKTTRQTVTLLGKIILEQDTSTKLPMFCSEFAWHMIALSNCTAEEIRSAPAAGASCVDEVFAPMAMVGNGDKVGLADGPLLSAMQLPAAARGPAIASIFAEGDAAKLSSGHRAVAQQIAPLMGPLSQFFGAKAAGATDAQMADAADQLNANFPLNYSPTGFLVQAMGDKATRKLDYVATVAFVNGSGLDKAKLLSRNPVP